MNAFTTGVLKTGVSLVVGSGVTKIVAGIIKNNTSPTNIYQKVTIWAAAFVIGTIITDVSKNYTDEKIDDALAWWDLNVTNREQ